VPGAVFGDDENDGSYIPTFPSASLQAKMEAEALLAIGRPNSERRNSGWDAF
jgi:hypothetical protein